MQPRSFAVSSTRSHSSAGRRTFRCSRGNSRPHVRLVLLHLALPVLPASPRFRQFRALQELAALTRRANCCVPRIIRSSQRTAPSHSHPRSPDPTPEPPRQKPTPVEKTLGRHRVVKPTRFASGRSKGPLTIRCPAPSPQQPVPRHYEMFGPGQPQQPPRPPAPTKQSPGSSQHHKLLACEDRIKEQHQQRTTDPESLQDCGGRR